jgi:1-deoxy-D-xylulose-5-phosphate reductoisomerase
MVSDAPRRVTILGATGSIGASTADVILRHPDRFSVEAVAGGRDVGKLAATARRLCARQAVIADPGGYQALRDALAGTGIAVAAGMPAVTEAAVRPADIVVAAIVGSAGLESTHAAVEAGRTVALANKEALVSAGAVITGARERSSATLLPMDSEHNAVFQCLLGHDAAHVERIVLTASGGPFRTWDAERIRAARPADALKHPNWSMGAKITIDSASMFNKGLELIEARWLFGVPAEKLDVVVHPQSIIHGFVDYLDGATVAALGNPDMRVPIAHCLAWPERVVSGVTRLDLPALASLTFEAPDPVRFPALRLAREALEAGGAHAAILNAANEIAVEAFLAGRLGFTGIAALVEQMLETSGPDARRAPDTIGEVIAVDQDSRMRAKAALGRMALVHPAH